jgi:hypothetical protein
VALDAPSSLAARARIEQIVLWQDEDLAAPAKVAEEPSLSEAELRTWSEEWKGQVTDISNQLRSLKSSLRVGPAGEELIGACESWLRVLEDLGERVQTLTKPFFEHTCYVSVINIIRTFQLLCAQVIKFIDGSLTQGRDGDWTAEALRLSQAKAIREVDTMVTVLNYNVPTLAIRNRNIAGEIGAGGGWKRRGEISNQGAALKLVLTKNESSKKFLTRRNVNSPTTGPSSSSSSSSTAAATAETSVALAGVDDGDALASPTRLQRALPSEGADGLTPVTKPLKSPSSAVTARRASHSGDWEEDD